MEAAISAKREFEFNDRDFAFLSKFVYARAGIVLAEHKRNMVYSRLSRRLRDLKYRSFQDYIHYLQTGQGEGEVSHLINAITTNLTRFFREEHHFEFLAAQLKQGATLFPHQKIRIWSAGCSAGMEVYSAAITIAQTLPSLSGWDIKLLATDIDTSMLDRGAQGIYRADELQGIDPEFIKRYFQPLAGGNFQIVPELREMVHFKRLNLIEDHWPMKGPFPLIFCRNVMIYFDKHTQKVLAQKFARLLPKPGYLLIGHSENLSHASQELKLIGRTVYERL